MRDRSGFDLDGKGQNDRAAIAFEAGFYNAYTDEAHGYGNAGTDDPPAQSPLDSTPQPGENAPDLNDAALASRGHPVHRLRRGPHRQLPGPGLGGRQLALPLRLPRLRRDGDERAGRGPGDLRRRPHRHRGVHARRRLRRVRLRLRREGTPVATPRAPSRPPASGPTTSSPGPTSTSTPRGPPTTRRRHGLTYEWDFDNDGQTDDTGRTVTHRFRDAGRPPRWR